MSRLIVSFYDDDRFGNLCGINSPLTDIIGKRNGNQGIFVDEVKNIQIINNNNNCILSNSLLLLPDKMDNCWSNTLINISIHYKILYHNITTTHQQTMGLINLLNTNENCKGYEKQMEEPDTAYALIGKYCDNNSTVTFDAIWQAIKDVDVLLCAKYKFIEQLADTTKTMPPLPSILSNIIVDYNPSSITNREKVYNEILPLLFGK